MRSRKVVYFCKTRDWEGGRYVNIVRTDPVKKGKLMMYKREKIAEVAKILKRRKGMGTKEQMKGFVTEEGYILIWKLWEKGGI